LEVAVSYTFGSDMFVTAFQSDGKKLLASTYIGGSENDGLRRFYLGFGGELEIYRFIRVNKLKFPFSLFKK
jgi:hypothetical protein